MRHFPASFPTNSVASARVLVVGDIMLDRYWFGEVERISPEAPVPVVKVQRREDRLGGAANVARNIAALGAQVSLVGIVGNDEPGQQVNALLGQAHIKSQLLMDEQCPTTLKMRVLGRQQQLLRMDFEEKPAAATLAGLHNTLQACLAQHDVVVLSDYAKGALQDVQAVIALAQQAGVPVLVDPKGREYVRYAGASVLTPNRLEMLEAIGPWRDEDDLAHRAQALRVQLNLEALLVTRSEQGMTLFTEAGRQHVGAQTHEVFDVSGAGDTVLATLAVMRAAGLGWFEAMCWANKAGGIVVGKLGTSVVTAQELTGNMTGEWA